jgi:hypothetical protein
MTAPLQDDDAALAKLQRETAQIDLELKKRELADKSSKWAIFRNPAVFVPISAAIASGIFGLIVASFQVYEDREKLQEQVNTSILIDALNGYPRNTTFDPAQSARKLRMFLDAGLLTDHTGALARYVNKFDPQ